MPFWLESTSNIQMSHIYSLKSKLPVISKPSVVFSTCRLSGYFQQFSIIQTRSINFKFFLQETKSHCTAAVLLMPKTINKFLSSVTLCDINPNSEQAYRDFKSLKALESPMVLQLHWSQVLTFIGLHFDCFGSRSISIGIRSSL